MSIKPRLLLLSSRHTNLDLSVVWMIFSLYFALHQTANIKRLQNLDLEFGCSFLWSDKFNSKRLNTTRHQFATIQLKHEVKILKYCHISFHHCWLVGRRDSQVLTNDHLSFTCSEKEEEEEEDQLLVLVGTFCIITAAKTVQRQKDRELYQEMPQ